MKNVFESLSQAWSSRIARHLPVAVMRAVLVFPAAFVCSCGPCFVHPPPVDEQATRELAGRWSVVENGLVTTESVIVVWSPQQRRLTLDTNSLTRSEAEDLRMVQVYVGKLGEQSLLVVGVSTDTGTSGEPNPGMMYMLNVLTVSPEGYLYILPFAEEPLKRAVRDGALAGHVECNIFMHRDPDGSMYRTSTGPPQITASWPDTARFLTNRGLANFVDRSAMGTLRRTDLPKKRKGLFGWW